MLGIPSGSCQLFQCMIAAIRPLRVEELAEIFAINLGPNPAPILVEGWRPEHPEDAVLSTCSTLVTIIDDRDSRIVQFSHFSVKEFLTSDRLRISEVGSIRDYYLPLEPAHAILARACLTVLLQLGGNVDKKRLATFPLAFYAARHCVDHAKYGDVISQIGHTMKDLFNPKKPYLASWTWMHGPQWEFERSIDDLSERPPLPNAIPLYYAASCGRLAEHLVISDPEDVNSTRGSDKTPLRAASRRGYTDVARVLLDHGANPNATNYADAPLTAAFDYNHLEVMQLLLARGVDLRASANLCGSTLRTAAFRGRTEVIQLLLRYHADANESDDNGMTALHCASTQGHFKVVQLLLEHGADANARTWNDYTPLRMASQRGYLDIVRLLLGHGADKQIQGKYDLTPLQAATAAGRHDIAQITIETCDGRE
ncbi:ankyrin repeat-containing domain protein [Russula brevipes]|nr:ankyrin repeat-containing domain protein [Russula brevipes]